VQSLAAAIAGFISRFNFLPANIFSLVSLGFFGNPLLFAISILLFDFAFKGIYPGLLFTYLGFACYPLLGWLARKGQTSNNQKTAKQLLAIPAASFLFFLISNFGNWFYWYERSWQELVLCYTLAVPFYARTLIGDITFGYGYLAYVNRNQLINLVKKVAYFISSKTPKPQFRW